MFFNEFVHKYELKNKTTSNIKLYQVLSALSLNDVGIFSRDEPFVSDIGIVYLHPSEGTQWKAYINENFMIPMVVLLHKNYLILL